MKEQAIVVARGGRNNLESRNLLREYLHHLILRQLFEKGLLQSLIFHGGTALRLLFGLRRFSEDLDFHLEERGAHINYQEKMHRVKSRLTSAGYRISTAENYEKTVISVFIRFHDLLQEVGIAVHENENLSVKLETDTRPPLGFTSETTFINKYFPFTVKHHDPPSFLAGKLHAILHRPYTKGRDIYDLMFYVSRWPELEPNLEYLNKALIQTGYDGTKLTKRNWHEQVILRLEQTDLTAVRRDVEPFLESEADLALMSWDNLRSLLS